MQQGSKEERKCIWQLRISNMFFGMCSATIGFHVLFLQTNGMTAGQVGMVMSLNAAVGVLAPPLWGLIADKIQSKYKVFLYALLGGAVTCFFVPVSATIKIGAALLSAGLVPLVNFFRMPSFSMLDAINVTASTQVKSMVYSDVRMWMSIGYTVMSVGYSPLIHLFGVGAPYYGFAVFSTIVFLLRKNLKQYDVKTEGKKSIPLKELEVSRLFKDYYLMVFLVINVLIQIPQNCAFFRSYLLEEIGGSMTMVGVLSGVRVTAEVLTMMGARQLKQRFSVPTLMAASAVSFLLEMGLYQLVGQVWQMAAVECFGGIAYGLILGCAINYVNELAPKGLEATAISLYSIGNPLAGVLANLFSGQIIMAVGVRTVYMYSFACVVLWLAIFYGSFFLGRRWLHKEPPVPLRNPKIIHY